MASRPGILSDWPWKPLGNFKFLLLAPWAIHSTYLYMGGKGESERDLAYFLVFPYLMLRMLHNQIWISLSRYRTAKGNNRIVDKGIEFEQVDRESTWDDQIIFNGILFYVGMCTIPQSAHLPFWRADGLLVTILLHIGPVEFLYYWLHRALHHHYLYSRYHSHHHSSIVTEPITSVVHPFAEHVAYFTLFAIPLLTSLFTRTASIVSFAGYIFFIDFMNNLGHCNFELIPNSFFSIFPPLKYLIYTPSYHSLHHTQFRTNFSLFMPLYDYIYNTVDKSTDSLHEASSKREEESADVVHLTHLTTPESIYHLRFGLASFASNPYSSKWYLWAMWPLTCISSFILTFIKGHAFISDRNSFNNLKLQSWVIPRYNIQYLLEWRKEAINSLIEEAILEADKKGVKVLSLGLLNQGEELNANGKLYIQKHPDLKVKVVDGSSLAVAVLLDTIPKGTTQVVFRAKLTKVAYAVVSLVCEKGIQVATLRKDEYEKLKLALPTKAANYLVHLSSTSKTYPQKVWLVGDDLKEDEQMKAAKGTIFLPASQFPPKKTRSDCYYHTTPSMIVPSSFENLHSCENWLPRKAMSAWRVGGIVHALLERNVHECGNEVGNVEEIWEAALRHGFTPLTISSAAAA